MARGYNLEVKNARQPVNRKDILHVQVGHTNKQRHTQKKRVNRVRLHFGTTCSGLGATDGFWTKSSLMTVTDEEQIMRE